MILIWTEFNKIFAVFATLKGNFIQLIQAKSKVFGIQDCSNRKTGIQKN